MLRVCIALTSLNDYEIISKAPLLSADGLECGKILYSGEHLIQLLTNDRTDILIVDSEIDGPDIFESVQQIKSQKKLEVIVLAPKAEFSLAYRAMKSQVCELLIRPFSAEQISNALLEASKRFKAQSTFCFSANTQSRSVFTAQLDSIIDGQKTIAEINHAFQTTFQEGLFRVLSFAIDFSDSRQITEISSDVWHTLQRFIHDKGWFHTYDIVYSIIYNEIRVVLNYPKTADPEILRMLPNMFLHLQATYSSSPGLKIFLGIGQAYSDINMLPTSSEESKKIIWTRMSPALSKNRVVMYTNDTLPDKYQAQILEFDKRITNAMDTLNKEAFVLNINAFFALPENILSSSFSRKILLNQVRYFRNKFCTLIDQFDNTSSFYHRTKMALLTSQTFTEYKRRYIRLFTDMFERLSAYTISSEQSKYATQAQNILKNNYMNSLTLDSVAKELGITPNYLSRLFHETTGKTFSDYLLSLRITAAQTLLIETRYSIKTIGCSVGYFDQRYFSRVFAKETGVTPSEYRSIHCSSPRHS